MLQLSLQKERFVRLQKHSEPVLSSQKQPKM